MELTLSVLLRDIKMLWWLPIIWLFIKEEVLRADWISVITERTPSAETLKY